jgi:hypothetical protein
MPIKIDAPRAVAWKFKSGILARILPGTYTTPMDLGWTATRGRWISESDYRKIMAVVHAIEKCDAGKITWIPVSVALDALRKKGKK